MQRTHDGLCIERRITCMQPWYPFYHAHRLQVVFSISLNDIFRHEKIIRAELNGSQQSQLLPLLHEPQ